MKLKLFHLYVSYGISICILFILSILFYSHLEDLSTSTNWVDHTYQVIQEIDRLKIFLGNAESSQRGFLLTHDSSFLKTYTQSEADEKTSILKLKSLINDNLSQQKNLSVLQGLISMRMNHLKQNMVPQADSSVFLEHLNRGKIAMDNCAVLFKKMDNEENNLLAARNKSKELYEINAPKSFKTIFLFSFLIFIISFFLIAREFRRRAAYQRDLERKVKELNRMTAELQEFSFITSHNMQEPLRKIRTFSNRLVLKHQEMLNDEGKLIVNRIDVSASQMHNLLNDFVRYTTIVNPDEKISSVNLNDLIKEVIDDFKNNSVLKKDIIDVSKLEVVHGYAKQLFTLFKCLLDNAIKFSKDETHSVIKISGEEVNWKHLPETNTNLLKRSFYKISVCDNGIGFDNAFVDKIFKLFQRLNSDDSASASKGVGLAIVQQIMSNHHGFVIADGKPNEGACFHLYFPMEKYM